MSSESDRTFTVSASDTSQESAITHSSETQQPMQIYRPPVAPLPGNRPIADNTTDDIDNLLGYLD